MKTTPTAGSGKLMSLASRLIVGSLLPRMDHAVEESTRAFTTPEMLRPNIGSKRYGWTHYGRGYIEYIDCETVNRAG